MKQIRDNVVLYSRIFGLMIGDIVAIFISSYLALLFRMRFDIDATFWSNYMQVWYIDLIVTIIGFWVSNLYKSLWEFISVLELEKLAGSLIITDIVKLILIHFVMDYYLPRSWYILDPLFIFLLCGGIRFAYREARSAMYARIDSRVEENLSRVLIVGAGDAGEMLCREMLKSSHIQQKIVGFIDDDPHKLGKFIHGIKILGNRNDILSLCTIHNVTDIYIALPSVSNQAKSEILNICKESKCKIKILPGMYQLINGEVNVSKLKDVEIEDLLGRDPITVNMDQITSYLKGKVVMVTGGGGSIGSELCRQIAAREPKMLIIVDIFENNAYDIQMELIRKFPDLNLAVRIASIRDEHKMDTLFKEFRPEIVYHAAAHKHVPLMEDSPNEAIKNNVFGTLNVVKAADKYHVQRFVQISTDKAVNPTNIMGATKRMCEMIIQAYGRRSETEFTAVRFGNVLGSSGSVIPLFKKQIADGGPVTVTHKDIIRYFMTIPEAVSLVIQAGFYAKGGEIFVLDMGKPVKIDDMARNLIKLSGYVPDVDIPIVYTGLRPGEKLYEELLMSEEGLQKTENEMIHIGKPIEFDDELYFRQLEDLRQELIRESDDIKIKVAGIVTTYHPWEK